MQHAPRSPAIQGEPFQHPPELCRNCHAGSEVHMETQETQNSHAALEKMASLEHSHFSTSDFTWSHGNQDAWSGLNAQLRVEKLSLNCWLVDFLTCVPRKLGGCLVRSLRSLECSRQPSHPDAAGLSPRCCVEVRSGMLLLCRRAFWLPCAYLPVVERWGFGGALYSSRHPK